MSPRELGCIWDTAEKELFKKATLHIVYEFRDHL